MNKKIAFTEVENVNGKPFFSAQFDHKDKKEIEIGICLTFVTLNWVISLKKLKVLVWIQRKRC